MVSNVLISHSSESQSAIPLSSDIHIIALYTTWNLYFDTDIDTRECIEAASDFNCQNILILGWTKYYITNRFQNGFSKHSTWKTKIGCHPGDS